MRQEPIRTNIDFGWKFTLSDVNAAKEEIFDDSSWRIVDLPHDWSIEGAYRKHHPAGKNCGFLPAGTGWYRKVIHAPDSWKNKCIFVEFDGIYMNSDVWINGCHLGHRPYGYMGFEYELTPFLHSGPNMIAVRADCSRQPSSRWYNGSGIYRHVWLSAVEKVHISHWGVSVTVSRITEKWAEVRVETSLSNKSKNDENVLLRTIILNPSGNEACTADTDVDVSANEPGSKTVQALTVPVPERWSPGSPSLYTAVSRVYKDGHSVDEYFTEFGIRDFEFRPEDGFFLNGTPFKFKGVCNHHDGGPAGAAVPDALLEKRLLMLKEMGCNAIRTSHNPFAPEFYRFCDRIGIMVMDEAFDGWETPKVPDDYGKYFGDWWEQDLGDMILRDRNHPCVIVWSIGNEVLNMNPDTTIKLRDYVHRLDPTRPVTCGIPGTGDRSDKNRELLDVAGYNDGGGACFVYPRDHERRPGQCFIATEAPHTSQTRGFYRTQTWWRDKNQPRIEIPNLTEEEIFYDGALEYRSSYDNSGVRTCVRDSWGLTEKYPYLCGEFRWTGFDYLGESFSWPRRSVNSGVIDLGNFKKDHFYLYKSMWTSEPMIHILPHWTHPGKEGTVIPVWVYTTCEEAELFLNGQSLGKQRKGNKKHLAWDVPYTPGTLKAAGYNKGKTAAETEHRTAGQAEKIRLIADKETLLVDGKDAVQISFELTDTNGVPVPSADNVVRYIIRGPARLTGMENGDPLDLTPPKAPWRKAFYGRGMGLIQAGREKGPVTVYAFGILGETVFPETCSVSIDFTGVMLNPVNTTGNRENLHSAEWKIFYTTDGSYPDRTAQSYTSPFLISCSTIIRAALYRNGSRLCDAESFFRKGKREKIIDLTHGNRELNSDRPAGPFAEQLTGEWLDEKYRYRFTSTGEFIRDVGADLRQLLGYWWYDFPADIFEAQDYAGTGEIWFSSGEKCPMALVTQEAEELVIQTGGAVGTAYESPDTLILKRKCRGGTHEE